MKRFTCCSCSSCLIGFVLALLLVVLGLLLLRRRAALRGA